MWQATPSYQNSLEQLSISLLYLVNKQIAIGEILRITLPMQTVQQSQIADGHQP